MTHKHWFKEQPSYTIKMSGKLTKVWMCAHKETYCHVRKEEVTNA